MIDLHINLTKAIDDVIVAAAERTDENTIALMHQFKARIHQAMPAWMMNDQMTVTSNLLDGSRVPVASGGPATFDSHAPVHEVHVAQNERTELDDLNSRGDLDDDQKARRDVLAEKHQDYLDDADGRTEEERVEDQEWDRTPVETAPRGRKAGWDKPDNRPAV